MEKVVERMKCGITIAWRRIVKNTFVAGFARRRTRSLQRGLMQITGVVQLYIVNRRRRQRCLTSGVHAGNGYESSVLYGATCGARWCFETI